VNRGAAGNILRMGKMAAMADSYLEKKAGEWLEEFLTDASFLPLAAFEKEEPIIWSYGVLELIKRLAGASKDIGLIHVEQVLKLRNRAVGKRISLPYGLTAVREYEGISIRRKEIKEEEEIPLPSVKIEIFSYEKGAEIPKNRYTKWFDCDKIKGTPVIRTRQPGDYITLADGSRKTLKRFMIDEKIPREAREQIPLLADGSHVMWVVGYRISGYYRVRENTSRILQAKIRQPDTKAIVETNGKINS
jgi:tRNA(Ile)-lysidine synthase